MTRAAIMQPYFFPYVGYFQLMRAVDIVVWLDDAQFSPRSWIVRNRVMVNGSPTWYSFPVRHGSQNSTIAQARYALDHPAAADAVKTIQRAYARRRGGDRALDLASAALRSPDESVARVNAATIQDSLPLLDISVETRLASDMGATHLGGTDRILEICRILGATTYVNLPGGRHLYRHDEFARHHLGLRFIEPTFCEYPQGQPAFVSGLSILDVIACLGEEASSVTRTFSLAE
jgi:hypothetical protein